MRGEIEDVYKRRELGKCNVNQTPHRVNSRKYANTTHPEEVFPTEKEIYVWDKKNEYPTLKLQIIITEINDK